MPKDTLDNDMPNTQSNTSCKHDKTFAYKWLDGSFYCPDCNEKLIDYLDIPRVRTVSWTDIEGDHLEVIEVIR